MSTTCPDLSWQNLVSVEIGTSFMLSHGYIKQDFDMRKWIAPVFLQQAAKKNWSRTAGRRCHPQTFSRHLYSSRLQYG